MSRQVFIKCSGEVVDGAVRVQFDDSRRQTADELAVVGDEQ